MSSTDGAVGLTLRRGEMVIVADVFAEDSPAVHREWWARHGLSSFVGVPVADGATLLGVLALEAGEPIVIGDEERRILSAFADRAAVAIRNAALFTQAEAARRAAERAARVKDEFLATMSHELRSPLNAILGLSEALEEQVLGPLTPAQRKATLTVKSSGEHLLALINDILDLARISSGGKALDVEAFDVHALISSAVQMVSPAAGSKQLKVEVDIAPDGETVVANERRLKQIVINLLGNALKFTPHGGRVGVRVEREPLTAGTRITVWDTGIGIARSDQERLFQPFQQLDSELHRRYPGAGLGLALSRRLAELHGGTIEVESEAGEGSRFVVRLPQPATSPGPRRLARASDPHPVAPPGDDVGGTILLAEDNEANVDTFEPYLRSKGHEVVVVRNGEEVVPTARRVRPDVVLMDIQLPGVDGLTLIRQFRTDPELSATPIIAVTAFGLPGDRERCLAAGADRYLAKPVRLKLIAETIDELFRAARRA